MPQMFLGSTPVQPIRRPVNPQDKTTIVSIFPREVKDDNPTIVPGLNIIPAAASNDFSILVVGPGSWFKELDEGQPHLEIQTGSLDIANAIVNVFRFSIMGSNGADRAPGLFIIPGKHDRETIKTWVNMEDPEDTFKRRLRRAVESQKNWFQELVNIADSDWAATNGSPRSISDLSRTAAIELGYKDKPWLKDFKSQVLRPCPACGNLVNFDYPVCQNCKSVINLARAKELGIIFAADLTTTAGVVGAK